MKQSVTKTFLSLFILMFIIGGISRAQTPYIEIVPMSALLKSQLELGDEYFVSTGLQNVGKGEHIYIRAVDRDNEDIIDYTWELTATPEGSNAEITHVINDIYFFTADEAGTYSVNLSITTTEGTGNTDRIFSGQRYTGVGGFGGTDVSFQEGHCATCHGSRDPEIIEAWEQSRHATIFQRGIDGEVPGFGPFRQRTATTGIAEEDLGSGSYFSLKAETGWEFPENLEPGNFDQLVEDHPQFAQVATIGCESCHGAGRLHRDDTADRDLLQVSYTSESCQSCHDATRPTAQFHSFRRSGHADPVWSGSFQNRDGSNSLQDCVRCHDGRGYVNFTKGIGTDTDENVYTQDDLVFISCESCHDPHAGGLRSRPMGSDTLSSGLSYADIDLGAGATCADCHKYRRFGEDAVQNIAIRVPGPPWGPHYVGAIDMLLGDGGYEFDTETPRSQAHKAIENTCVGCHMTTAEGDLRNLMGDHSWSMTTVVDDTQYDLVESCVTCHAGITSFSDLMGADYNMSGTVQPFVDEVQALLDTLAAALPPLGEPTVNAGDIDNDDLEQKGAYWNYLYVRNDKSNGIHNPKYTIALLQRSISTITGIEFDHTPDMPGEYALHQNYPNPFNPTTQIEFTLPEQSDVVLEIYDITGRRINTLINDNLSTGTHTVTWDATNQSGQTVSSGVYIYRLQADSFVETKRMVFIK